MKSLKIKDFIKRNRTTIFTIIILYIIMVIVHYRLLFNISILTNGDWGFYFNSSIKENSQIIIWNNTNLGNINLTLSYNIVSKLIPAFLSNLGLGFNYAERILFIYPYIILAPLGMFLLAKKVINSNLSALISSFVFTYNPYVLNTISGGSLLILVASTLIPYALLIQIKLLEEKKFYYSILQGLLLTLIGAYEFRILYITCLLLTVYILYYIFIVQKPKSKNGLLNLLIKVSLPFLIVLILNSYWIIPLLNLHLITNNALFNRGIFTDGTSNLVNALTNYGYAWLRGANNNIISICFLWTSILLAIIGFSLNRKNKLIIFFGIITVLGIILSKELDPPFGKFYSLLFHYLPGFNAFREASKFQIITSIGYAILIGALIKALLTITITKKYKYLLITIIAVLILQNTMPLIDGSTGRLFIPKDIPNDYIILKDYLDKETSFSRTMWVPTPSRWGINNNAHPTVDIYSMLYSSWNNINSYQNIFYPDYFILEFLFAKDTPQILTASNIEYVIVPGDFEKNDKSIFITKDIINSYLEDEELIDLDTLRKDTRDMYIKALDKLSYLKKVDIGSKNLIVYKNLNFKTNNYFNTENNGYLKINKNTDSIVINKNKDCESLSETLICPINKFIFEKNSRYLLRIKYAGQFSYKLVYEDNSIQEFETPSSIDTLSYEKTLYTGDIDKVPKSIIFYSRNLTNKSQVNSIKIIHLQDIENRNYINDINYKQPLVQNIDINDIVNKKVFIHSVLNNFELNMSEGYDNNWKIFLIDSNKKERELSIEEAQHYRYYDSLNSWKIDTKEICSQNKDNCKINQDGSYDMQISIHYEPQDKTNIFIIVSLVALIISMITFIILLVNEK